MYFNKHDFLYMNIIQNIQKYALCYIPTLGRFSHTISWNSGKYTFCLNAKAGIRWNQTSLMYQESIEPDIRSIKSKNSNLFGLMYFTNISFKIFSLWEYMYSLYKSVCTYEWCSFKVTIQFDLCVDAAVKKKIHGKLHFMFCIKSSKT